MVLSCLLLGGLAPAPAGAQDEPWTTEDIIDPRIDVDAQYALMRMMSHGDLAAAFDASAMLWEVKNGDLLGIHQADREKPAKLVRAAGGNWWEIVPKGFDAVCYLDADVGKAMLVYRVGIGDLPARLDPALRSAWNSCGIKPAAPRGYRVTITKPPPPPPQEYDPEPPPANGLTVRVVDGAGAPQENATVDVSHDGGGDAKDTGASGTVTFADVPAGAVTVNVIGPQGCTDEWLDLVMEDKPMTIDVPVDCTVPTPDPPAQCDPAKYSQVFDPCGKAVLDGAVECLKDAHGGFWSCKGEWKCAGKKLGEFWSCKNDLDHKAKIRQCNDKANAASNCSYPGPQ